VCLCACAGEGECVRVGLGAGVCVPAAGATRAQSWHAAHLGSFGSRWSGRVYEMWICVGRSACTLHTLARLLGAPCKAHDWRMHGVRQVTFARVHVSPSREPVDQRTYLGSFGCLGMRDHGMGSCVGWWCMHVAGAMRMQTPMRALSHPPRPLLAAQPRPITACMFQCATNAP
jgi:hypothetical protein